LGSGTLFDFPILEPLGIYEMGYKNNGMMLLPPMALIMLALVIWAQRSRTKSLIEKE
jgi:Na+-transporting NADH:ubiquinone oxidoreductase subunit D